MTLIINDLEQDEELDRAAMKKIAGSGLVTISPSYMTQQYYYDSAYSAKSYYEESKELQKLAFGVLEQHYSYQSSFIQKFTS